MARHLCELNRKPFFIAFVCRGDGVSVGHGEPIGECVKALEPFFEHPLFWCFGVNCVDTCAVSSLMDEINKELAKLPAGKKIPKRLVYPNSGEVFSFDTYSWSGMSEEQKD